jgi:hypothetical protein
MYGVRGILKRSVSTHVTRNATTTIMPNAASASCHVKPGSALGIATLPTSGRVLFRAALAFHGHVGGIGRLGSLDPKPMGRKSKSCYVGGRLQRHVLRPSP